MKMAGYFGCINNEIVYLEKHAVNYVQKRKLSDREKLGLWRLSKYPIHLLNPEKIIV
jgi:hypothetical protein